MNKLRLLLPLAALLLSTLAFAQSGGKVVKGVVLASDDNQPIIGASVLVKGTKMVTVTDIDGMFTLSGVPASATQLEVESIGMKKVGHLDKK